MRRALLLAKNGEGRVSPNPMVGAVITYDDRIIGEGFHAFYGGPHAEVNAINSVKAEDRHLLKDSTIYVSLEPCAHHGKTPPCADLIVKTGIPNVVVGCLDPNPLVSGKGINILENDGIKVTTGVLEAECKEINKKFIKSQSSDKPYIILKWAQSSDGFMATFNEKNELIPVKFSSSLSSVWVHRLRSSVDAILVGSNTEKIDKPLLNVRFWGGKSPQKIVVSGNMDCDKLVRKLRKEGITSLIVEGGSKLLESFISQQLFDEIRIETALLPLGKGLKAPELPCNIDLKKVEIIRENIIQYYDKTFFNCSKDVKKA